MQKLQYSALSHGRLPIWQALALVSGPTHQGPPRSAEGGVERALAVAEACRAQWPQHDWLHLVGLLHGLGMLMALPE